MTEEARHRPLEGEEPRCARGPAADAAGRVPPSGPGPAPPPPPAVSSMGRAGAASRGSKAEPSPPPDPSQDGGSDSEEAAHPQQHNRTRQKKFVKNFKQLPSEEVVLQRYSCALMSDILLQGHLYVTENYIAFHSNVFGYVTRVQIPMISITNFTKEKTAKIIPNAVAVSTLEDTHTFTSFISREATYKVMTKAWRKALNKHNLANLNNEDLGDDDIDDIEEVDGYDNHLDDESTDSMTSATNLDTILPLPRENPYHVKRLSGTGGLVFYQERTNLTSGAGLGGGPGHQTGQQEAGRRLLAWVLFHPPSTLLLAGLTTLLVLLFCCSVHLVLRLDRIQQRVDSALPEPATLEQLAGWQSLLHSQSSRKVQEYLNTNLEQISKVRESLERLAQFLQSRKDPAAAEE